MPKRPLDMEDILAERLEVVSPEHQKVAALIDEAMLTSGLKQPDMTTLELPNLYDEDLLKLIDSVTLE